MKRTPALELFSVFRLRRRRSIVRGAAAVRRYVTMADHTDLDTGRRIVPEALPADGARRAWASHDQSREQCLSTWRRSSLQLARRTRAWIVLALLALTAACREPTTPSRCANLPSVQGWTNLGPPGKGITAVALTPAGLLVGTSSDGVLSYDSCSGRWVGLGLSGRIITSVRSVPPARNRLLATVIPLAPDTVSAVLYASDDNGATWYARDGGLSAQRGYYGYAFSLAFDASDANRLYLGLPASVVRSVDGGATWSSVFGDPLAPGIAVSTIATSPQGTGRVWASGQDMQPLAFVLRSDDRGNTWHEFRPSPYSGDAVLSSATDPSTDDRLYVGMGGAVRMTEDGGASWRSVLSLRAPGFVTGLSQADSMLVAVSDEQMPNSVPLATALGLYVTRDRGVSWDTLAVPASASGGTALAIGPGPVAFVGTRSGLWSVPLR